MDWKARAVDAAHAEELVVAGEVERRLFSSGTILRLGQAWHGLHWLLAGDLWEPVPGAGSAILGGVPIGQDIYGYGPALFHSSIEVSDIAAGLDALDEAELCARYAVKAVRSAKPYPFYSDWEEVHFDQLLLPAYTKLTGFYSGAAVAGRAVVATLY